MLVRLPGLDEQTRAADTLRPVLGENYVVALNLASTVPPWLEALRARPMLLGLDLQGGVHFLLQVDQKAALEKRLDAYAEDIRVALREARVAYESVERHGIDGTIVATLGEGADQDAAQRAILAALPTIQLSMEGGGVVTAKVPDAEVNQIVSSAIEQTVGTPRTRINEISVAAPIIHTPCTNRALVHLTAMPAPPHAPRTPAPPPP